MDQLVCSPKIIAFHFDTAVLIRPLNQHSTHYYFIGIEIFVLGFFTPRQHDTHSRAISHRRVRSTGRVKLVGNEWNFSFT